MKETMQILGVTRFKGSIDGRDYDTTKLLTILPFDPNNHDRAGFDTRPMTYGKSDNFVKFQGRKFPLTAEVDYSVTAGSRGAEFSANEVKFNPIENQAQK